MSSRVLMASFDAEAYETEIWPAVEEFKSGAPDRLLDLLSDAERCLQKGRALSPLARPHDQAVAARERLLLSAQEGPLDRAPDRETMSFVIEGIALCRETSEPPVVVSESALIERLHEASETLFSIATFATFPEGLILPYPFGESTELMSRAQTEVAGRDLADVERRPGTPPELAALARLVAEVRRNPRKTLAVIVL